MRALIRAEPFDLRNQPRRQHLIYALIDSIVQDIARPFEREHFGIVIALALRVQLHLPRLRNAGQPVDLDRAGHAAHIVFVQPRGAFGIDFGKHRVQSRPAPRLTCNIHQFAPERFIAFFRKIHRANHGVDVQSRAAAQHGLRAARIDFIDLFSRQFAVLRRGKLLRRIRKAQQMMRDPAHFIPRRARGQNIHAAINLHRIGGDHLSADSPAQFHRARRLAGGGRTCDYNQFLFIHIIVSA